MINEERVKQLYKVALYEQKEEKLHKQTSKYYKSDYVGKELLKSIFTGTTAYLLVLVFCLINKWETFLNKVNQLDMERVLIPLLFLYVTYMAVYLGITYAIYKTRYADSNKHLEEYEKELHTLNNMYEREEKLK